MVQFIMVNDIMRKKDFQAILVIAAFYIVIELAGITCPIRFITGVSCAGCGMSRAWLALLRWDLSSAFAYHPLFWLPVPAVFLLLFHKRIPSKGFRFGMAAVIVLFLAVYVVRLLMPEDTVVTFDPGQGLVLRLLSGLWR